LGIDESVQNDVTIYVDIYANETINLIPCEKVFISTGLFLDCYIPITHNIKFVGHTLTCGIQSFDKIFCSSGKEELKILVVNYHECEKKVYKNMPLGKLVISPNIEKLFNC